MMKLKPDYTFLKGCLNRVDEWILKNCFTQESYNGKEHDEVYVGNWDLKWLCPDCGKEECFANSKCINKPKI